MHTQIKGFNNENTEVEVQIIINLHLNDCMRVATTKYTPNYNKLAEETVLSITLIP
jgi:hypothetical protein